MQTVSHREEKGDSPELQAPDYLFVPLYFNNAVCFCLVDIQPFPTIKKIELPLCLDFYHKIMTAKQLNCYKNKLTTCSKSCDI